MSEKSGAVQADRERRITEGFAKAVEQLGSDKLETRLGAIYTLERISRESEREYWPIMETLTAFVREHAPWPPREALRNPFVELQVSGGDETEGENTPAEKPKNEEQSSAQIRSATDIQAVLTVLGRRDETARARDETSGRRLDRAATDLRGANLRDAHLERAHLEGAHLEGANFWGAHLEGAHFYDAHLEGGRFFRAHLEGADFSGAHLEGARLGGAYLEGADFSGAHLKGAYELMHAHGANFSGAHLERADLERSWIRRRATGKGTELTRPAHRLKDLWATGSDKRHNAWWQL